MYRFLIYLELHCILENNRSSSDRTTLMYSCMFYIAGNNIALGKPTQQTPYDYCEFSSDPWKVCEPWVDDACPGCFGSDLAVDGDTNRDFRHGSCAHTNRPTTSMPISWSVNLEGSYYLLGINVYNSRYFKEANNSIHNIGEHNSMYSDCARVCVRVCVCTKF